MVNLIKTKSFELAIFSKGDKNSSKLAILIPGRLDTKDYANFVSHADYLADKGFAQYEISNFSKPGFCCKHNYAYWNNDPYTGLGPSAVSYADGVRRENIPDVSGYIDKVRSGLQPVGSSEKLSPEERAKETAAVKIRTMKGIGFDWFKKKTGLELPDLERKVLPKLIVDGLIEHSKSGPATQGVRLTRKGILFCDTVSSAFL